MILSICLPLKIILLKFGLRICKISNVCKTTVEIFAKLAIA